MQIVVCGANQFRSKVLKPEILFLLFDPSGTEERVIRNVNEPRVGFSVVDVDRMKRNTKCETGAAQLTRKGARGSNHNIFPLSFIRVA